MGTVTRRFIFTLAAAIGAAALSATAAGAPIEEPLTSATTDVATRGPSWSLADAPERAVLISDSAIAGIRWTGALPSLTNTTWDDRLESCRRLVRSSCRGREGYAPLTAQVELQLFVAQHGHAGPNDVLIIATGYNDWHGTFLNDFTTVMNQARVAGFERIGWLTYREANTYVAPGVDPDNTVDYVLMNAILRSQAQSGAWPELTLLEYDLAMRGQASWFSSDGIHVTVTGAHAVAHWLSNQVLFTQTPFFAPDNWVPYADR